MNREQLNKLLVSGLAQQDEPVAAPEIDLDDAELRDIVTGQRTLNTQEQQALLISPALRRRLYFLADVIRAETYAAWQQEGIDPVLHYQAAASSEVEPVTVDNNPDFTLTLYPLDDMATNWTLHLQVSLRIRDLTPKGIRLLDDAGETWLAGQPDADGELSADWVLSGSPVERLHSHTLKLQAL